MSAWRNVLVLPGVGWNFTCVAGTALLAGAAARLLARRGAVGRYNARAVT